MSSVIGFPIQGADSRPSTIDVQPGVPVESRPIRLLYTVADTAELLSIGLSSVYDLINAGDLPKVMVGTRGKTTRIAATDIQAYIDNQRVVVESSWAM
ncbi:helix-turn-helix domain-containing protein [Glutamicibacter arilaitensis]|uniref:helix-turn-helix domain-containing protein n=1 Tax=Glutamicibacter arilaitensis TaxID=256701 RepID=UPI003F93A589